MADIELVIKIPEELYRNKKGYLTNMDAHMICDAVAKGTPLPKGHGRLIDADKLYITTITTDDYSGNEVLDVVLKEDIDSAPTIIEADKEESEEVK